MDIVKQLQIIFLFLVLLLAAPNIMRRFNVEIDYDMVRRVLLLPERQKASSERELVTKREIEQVFDAQPAAQAARPALPAPSAPQPPQAQTADLKARITGLENYAALSTNPEYSTPGVPPMLSFAPFTNKIKWIGPPLGFTTKEIYSFMIYRQHYEVTPKISALLSKIHGNLMLDLLPFTMVSKPRKKLIMLFNDKQSYSGFTLRPPWSGACCDIQRDTLYVVESADFYPLSVHELTHLYFDGFFLPKRTPLWLSEGMAVYMQSNAPQGRPEWIERSVEKFKQGNYMPLEDFVKVTSLEKLNAQQAEMWYAQAYSVVEFMMNMRTRDDFYKFCVNLKNGLPDYQALYRAYGLPFTKFETLESVWIHDLQKGKYD